ncbi:MAG: peptidase S10 [Coriobacteriales bacterium]|jgi:carboxypeptidase C (cathepsin A)
MGSEGLRSWGEASPGEPDEPRRATARAEADAAGTDGEQGSRRAEKGRRFASHPKAVSAHLTWHGTTGAARRDGEGPEPSFGYVATAGHVDIREDDGKPIGSMFCLTYVRDGFEGDPAARPVTFAFNGGPGSASVPVNVGGIGLRIVAPNGDRRIGPAPFDIVDNPDTLLADSDLVFVDALGTGWSELAEGVKGKRAWGVDADAECFARFVEAWLELTGRYNSPLYLFGESYGTTRCAVLARILEQRGIALSGIVMLSSIFDWAPTNPGNDANYVELLPTYAAIARYHGRSHALADRSDDELFEEASRFAEERLAPALLRGDRLDAATEAELAGRMGELIGLPAELLRDRHLRVELTDFRSELLRDEGLVCGRLDGRFAFERGNFLQTSREGRPEEDPSDSALNAAWTHAWHQVVSGEIGYRNPRPYLVSNYDRIGPKWDFTHTGAGVLWESTSPNVAYDLAFAMRHNPLLRVLFVGGRYDLATPFLGTVEDVSRMYLGDRIKGNIGWRLYDSGHMVYENPQARARMARDVEEFFSLGR